jgi:hypothetical protein
MVLQAATNVTAASTSSIRRMRRDIRRREKSFRPDLSSTVPCARVQVGVFLSLPTTPVGKK